jgi:hypothetical protein
MRKLYVVLTGLCLSFGSYAQTDTSAQASEKIDTIKIGSLIIIKKGDGHYENKDGSVSISHQSKKNENISTNWIILDLGFSNYTDNTNFSSSAAQQFAPGLSKGDFGLRTGKSVNVNLWFFMQRLNMIKHVVNLKYGLGLELNNYRYDANLYYKKNPPMVVDSALHFSKNKLAADYITVPLMLNFNFTPNNENNKSFGISAGVSAGYLYSSRQKFKTSETGKEKTKGDLGLEPFKLSYIAELQLGPVKLYGSVATKSMFKNGLDQTPYNLGLRFSNW